MELLAEVVGVGREDPLLAVQEDALGIGVPAPEEGVAAMGDGVPGFGGSRTLGFGGSRTLGRGGCAGG